VARNVEIKARVDDLAALREKVSSLCHKPPTVLLQRDIFFIVPHGRLKLRDFCDGTGELIYYERPDHAAPKQSSYTRSPCSDPATLSALLGQALGVRGVIEKRREVFLVDHTRIHLDDVPGLGTFLEIEAVLQDGDTVEGGEKVVLELLRSLRISESVLVEQAYIDLKETRTCGGGR
jgi:predicted adenylyl cyclase CyaB